MPISYTLLGLGLGLGLGLPISYVFFSDGTCQRDPRDFCVFGGSSSEMPESTSPAKSTFHLLVREILLKRELLIDSG